MDTHHTWRFRVRSYEVGADGEVRPIVYLNYLEEVAVQGSDVLGYERAWYEANRRVWVIRKLTLRHFSPARAGDELALTTWIGETRRVQANREYDLRRADGQPILRARHVWVYLNTDTLLPERLPADFARIQPPEDGAEPIDLRITNTSPNAVPALSSLAATAVERRAEYSDLDENLHVNNAVYVQWVEQAIADARQRLTLPLTLSPDSRTEPQHPGWRRLGREVDYFRSAVEGDPLRLTTRIAELNSERLVWLTDIRHSATDNLIAQDRSLWQISEKTK